MFVVHTIGDYCEEKRRSFEWKDYIIGIVCGIMWPWYWWEIFNEWCRDEDDG
jgi:hypothetical protein